MNLLRRLIVIDGLTAALMIFTFIYPLALAFTRKIYNDKKLIRIILGCVPLLLGVILFPILSVKGNPVWFSQRYTAYYVLLAFCGIWNFIPKSANDKEKKISIYRISTMVFYIAFVPLWIFAGYAVVGIFGGPHLDNHSRQGWADSFESMTYDMQNNYVLRDWKEIDFDELRSTYLPQVEQAEKDNDSVMYAKILREYIYEFHDSHIWLEGLDTASVAEADRQLAGNDHGFSMYRLDSGDFIAVLCDEESEAYKAGIHDGTVITSWDGEDVDTAAENLRCIHNYPFEVKENEDIMKPIYLAGQGDMVTVGFIDDDGNEQSVTLEKTGDYSGRLESALSCFYSFSRIDMPNLQGKMLTDDVAYLRIGTEQYNELTDVMAYLTGKYPAMNELLSDELSRLESEGMKKIIIDARNNMGGYIEISMAAAAQFNDVPLVDNEGIYSGGKYKVIHSVEIEDNGKWCNIPVVVLTNDRCVSSGDCLVDLFSRSSNTIVMGITSSSCSAQEIGGISVLTDDMFEIWYPVLATINENGEPLGDVKSDREARVELDVRIPVDKDAALTIFSDDKTDYELEYAVEYLEKQ